MKIGIISDSHDHLENLDKALKVLKEEKVNEVIHCGDFCAPFILLELDKLNIPVHCVFGNIDDRYSSTKVAGNSKNITLYGDLMDIVLDGLKICVTHQPAFAKAFAFTGKYDLVCHGHNHIQKKEMINETILLNPGEIMGRKGKASISIFDTKTKEIRFVDL